MDYQQYIQSPEWRNKSRNVRTFWDNRCAVCNSGGRLHVHHRSYANLGHEHFNDLILLCDHCHALFHQKIQPRNVFNQIEVLLRGIPK